MRAHPRPSSHPVHRFWLVPLLGTLLVFDAVASRAEGPESGSVEHPHALTFNRDVAPIIFGNCSSCHRPGESAPFSLLSYRDVAKRGEQIAQVTESRYMPPWKPEPGRNAFVGDRSLGEEEIETIARWVAEGKLEGDAADLPALPEFTDGWLLGEPDLVVSMPEPYTLKAEGRDVYRNFVIPCRVPGTKYVRAIEFRPDNLPIVHHTLLFVDRTEGARARDLESEEVGYDGMGGSDVSIPSGQFVGWVPGKIPLPGSAEVSWEVDGRTDLVVQTHMRPTGKAEELRMSLGLYFNDKPPTRHPVSIRVATRDIDIPAGTKSHTVESTYELPVDVDIIGIYPHAHYLGKDVSITATLPNLEGGDSSTSLPEEKWLLHIPSWDFNWQDEYRFAAPIHLPAGSVIKLAITYDNTAENPLNPNSPPIHVAYGPQSSDEMAEVVIQVMAAVEDRPILMQHYEQGEIESKFDYYRQLADADPEAPQWAKAAADYAMEAGRPDLAAQYFVQVVDYTGGKSTPTRDLARALRAAGNAERSLQLLDGVLAKNPMDILAVIERARAYSDLGRQSQAQSELERIVVIAPTNVRIHVLLGELLAKQGEKARAMRAFETVLRLKPGHIRASWMLAELKLEAGQTQRALKLCRRILHRHPSDSNTQAMFGRVLAALGNPEKALLHYSMAHRLAPENAEHERLFREAEAQSR